MGFGSSGDNWVEDLVVGDGRIGGLSGAGGAEGGGRES